MKAWGLDPSQQRKRAYDTHSFACCSSMKRSRVHASVRLHAIPSDIKQAKLSAGLHIPDGTNASVQHPRARLPSASSISRRPLQKKRVGSVRMSVTEAVSRGEALTFALGGAFSCLRGMRACMTANGSLKRQWRWDGNVTLLSMVFVLL